MPELAQMREQARRAARYFAAGLEQHRRTWLAVEIDGVVFVAARGDHAVTLAQAIDGGLLGEGKVDRPDEPAPEPPTPAIEVPTAELVRRFHAPAEESKYRFGGKIHLHTVDGITAGRRVRGPGECLCSKKHGSNETTELPASADLCGECVTVAQENGLAWS